MSLEQLIWCLAFGYALYLDYASARGKSNIPGMYVSRLRETWSECHLKWVSWIWYDLWAIICALGIGSRRCNICWYVPVSGVLYIETSSDLKLGWRRWGAYRTLRGSCFSQLNWLILTVIDRSIPAGQLYAVILLQCFYAPELVVRAFARIVLDRWWMTRSSVYVSEAEAEEQRMLAISIWHLLVEGNLEPRYAHAFHQRISPIASIMLSSCQHWAAMHLQQHCWP